MSLTACSSGPPSASASAKRYELKGKVVSADRGSRQVTIDHEAIPEYMDKMTMPFTLTKSDDWLFDLLKPGAQIQATLIVDGGKSWLESPVVTTITDSNLARSEETGIEPAAGTKTPDFKLINQDGKKISLKQYNGRALILTFIYTRCPLPDYCPLMSQNFVQIKQELQKNPALKEKTHLLSISIDPENDKPKVLREYGARYTDTFSQWEFASGSEAEIKEVAKFFGLNFWTESDQIIHGLRTAIIAPDGKVFKVYRENDWKPEQLLKDLESLKI
ncbi:MAG: SCO family protein [Acidobacteria bacterium]|nr:SCO family protein [Acidobacteriota bacterium]